MWAVLFTLRVFSWGGVPCLEGAAGISKSCGLEWMHLLDVLENGYNKLESDLEVPQVVRIV